MKGAIGVTLLMTAGILVVGVLVGFFYVSLVSPAHGPGAPATAPTVASQPTSGQAAAVVYNPPTIDSAPADLKEAVLFGAHILTDTQILTDGVGATVKCTNCHFNAGVTQGGQNGGISLVGVAATYPKYRDRQKYTVDLVARVNDWMTRSENGKVLPSDSKEMTAIVTYLQWISKDVPIYGKVPWLGVEQIKSDHKPDATAGSQVFANKCATCHGPQGQGQGAFPPLWGDHSFNDGAGMANSLTLSGFAHMNMPRGNPDLTVEQALDVGAFVDSQPRPHFQK